MCVGMIIIFIFVIAFLLWFGGFFIVCIAIVSHLFCEEDRNYEERIGMTCQDNQDDRQTQDNNFEHQ